MERRPCLLDRPALMAPLAAAVGRRNLSTPVPFRLLSCCVVRAQPFPCLALRSTLQGVTQQPHTLAVGYRCDQVTGSFVTHGVHVHAVSVADELQRTCNAPRNTRTTSMHTRI